MFHVPSRVVIFSVDIYNSTHLKRAHQNAIERAHAAWLEGRITKTGVMIHNVISEVDMGKPILVKEIPFIKGVDEDLKAFEQRVHEIEWGTVIEGIALVIKEINEKKTRAVGA